MSIYVSVISHGHCDLIKKLSSVVSLLDKFVVVIKSNKPGDNFDGLTAYDNFHWLDNDYYCGFGANNNLVFKYCVERLGMRAGDIFIVLNPDVVIAPESISILEGNMTLNNDALAAINLFKDFDFIEHDNSIRKFPTLSNFFKSFIGLGNSSVLNKSELTFPCAVDWAAGSFLAFFASHYYTLQGFDEKYFMYCEDVDICYRSSLLNFPVKYYPDIKATHLAHHANRKIFTKHFYWHLSSAFRFLLTKAHLTKCESILKDSFLSFGVYGENDIFTKK